MTLLYLLRHGATDANSVVPYRLQGQATDLPLNALGIAQSRQAASALATQPLVAIYTSPLSRARQTAAILADPHGLQPIVVHDLIEADLGRWDGLTWNQIADREPELHARFLANSGTVPYPEGESFLVVQRRVVNALAKLAAAHSRQCIAAVSHNVVNRAYLAAVLNLPIDAARHIRQANGGINLIVYDGDHPEVETLNACLHLHQNCPAPVGSSVDGPPVPS